MKKHHGACIGHVINSQGCVVPWEEESINKPDSPEEKPSGQWEAPPSKYTFHHKPEEKKFTLPNCKDCNPDYKETETTHEKESFKGYPLKNPIGVSLLQENKCERIGGCLGIVCPHSSELKPVSHEKDFLEEVLSEFAKLLNPMSGELDYEDARDFLKEKLHEAKVLGAEMYYLMGEENGLSAGRLAMKEEIEEIVGVEYMVGVQKDVNRVLIKILAAIREMK